MFKNRHTFTLLAVLIILCLVVVNNYGQDPYTKRTIQLKIVVDETFRLFHGWEELIGDVIKKSSKQFDEQLGIRLKIRKIEKIDAIGPTQDNTDIELGAEWLPENIDPEDCDIVIFFSIKDHEGEVGCVDEIFGRYALIIYDCRKLTFQEVVCVVIHEIGHLFGAIHNNFAPGSVMSGSCESLKFDEFNKELILKNKWRNFKEQPKKN